MRTILRRWATTAAWLACAWSVVFAACHAYWALGGTVGLGPVAGTGVRGWRPYDVVAAGTCVAMAGLAIALAHPARSAARAHRVRLVAAAVGAVLLLRGLFGLGQIGWDLVVEASGVDLSAVWELWLVEGGLLWLAAAGICAKARTRSLRAARVAPQSTGARRGPDRDSRPRPRR